MSYDRKSIQILGGGFNMLPPGDKVPVTDYLLCQNFRPDRKGKLVSRYGFPLKFTITDGTAAYAHSAAVYGGVEGPLYVVCNSVGGVGSLYYSPGGAVFGAAIATGLSGNRVGLVPMNGWMWIMDSLVQGKHNGASGFLAWGLSAPANPCIAADSGIAVVNGPSGAYQFYVTFQTTDQSVESNPGPGSLPVTVTNGDSIALTGIPISTDPQVGARNLYVTGGTLGQAYLIGTINDNVTTVFTWSTSDLTVTNNGVAMSTTNDGPPAANGMIGPHFARLFAWKGSRLFYTDSDIPQYWPGSGDPQDGNWVDVGADGEDIVWCTIHTNVMIIYKERAIWRLIGDPDSGSLEMLVDGIGLTGPFAVANAGPVDYFVAPTGLYVNTMEQVTDICDPVRPLFGDGGANNGSLTAPGSILPPAAFAKNAIYAYAVSLGYALGKLYVAYQEKTASGGTQWNILIYYEPDQRWSYYRPAANLNLLYGFQGFLFDAFPIALSGGGSGPFAQAFFIDDFRSFYTQDYGALPIECVYQSHYEDAGLPDNQKVWLDVVVDFEFQGDTATVYAAFNTGTVPPSSLGIIGGTGRQQISLPIPVNLSSAKNISILIRSQANGLIVIHNVHLYYYVEARLASFMATMPTDLGIGKVKQCKELQLDIDTSNGGAAAVQLYSDLPGNSIVSRQQLTVGPSGRALLKLPFSTTEGYLWKLSVYGNGFTFRLYSARLLMRVVGVYVEAYEAAAGFVWDSMEQTFDSVGATLVSPAIARGSTIKRAREIRLEIDTFGGTVTVNLLSDLPGNAQAIRFTGTASSSGGRRFVSIPLPAGTNAPIEGRIFRMQLSGAAKFILYSAALEILPVGVYLEAYEAAAGAVWDSRELDLGIPDVKEARELELDIETTSSILVQLLSDLTATFNSSNGTTGRQKLVIPLTLSAANEQFIEGRLMRVILSGSSAFRLYGARLRVRAFGMYLTTSEAAGGALWDSTDLDLGTQTVKQFRQVELDLWAYGGFTVTVYTDLPDNKMTARATVVSARSTTGRTKVQIPLQQGAVPDNYVFGRLVRVTITSSSAFKLFGARIDARAIGTYIETYEAQGGAVWDSTPNDLGNPLDKIFYTLRIEMDSDGPVACALYTDLPGEAFVSRFTGQVAAAATSRHFSTLPLPAGSFSSAGSIEGRSVRLVLSGASGFRLYKAQILWARYGSYLSAGVGDNTSMLEFDFKSERIKAAKRIEIDILADGVVTVAVITDATGTLTQQWSTTIATAAGRQVFGLALTPGIRGRLLRVAISSLSAARIFQIRLLVRTLNEKDAAWAWEDYPLHEGDILPAWGDFAVEPTPATFTWSDLAVPPTSAELSWAPLPVVPTPPEWNWAQILSVEATSDVWQWVDVPVNVE